VAGLGAFLASRLLLPSQMPSLLGFLSRGGMVLAVYPVLLFAMGFYQPREVAATVALFRGVRRGRPAPAEAASELAGEIITTSMPDETGDLGDVSPEPGGVSTSLPDAKR